MSEFRIEQNSPIDDLREGEGVAARTAAWLKAAFNLVDEAIARDRDINGCSEEVQPLLTNRQADHLAFGLSILSARFELIENLRRETHANNSELKHATYGNRVVRATAA